MKLVVRFAIITEKVLLRKLCDILRQHAAATATVIAHHRSSGTFDYSVVDDRYLFFSADDIQIAMLISDISGFDIVATQDCVTLAKSLIWWKIGGRVQFDNVHLDIDFEENSYTWFFRIPSGHYPPRWVGSPKQYFY